MRLPVFGILMCLLCTKLEAQVRTDSPAAGQDSLELQLRKARDLFHELTDSLRHVQFVMGQANKDLTFSGTRITTREAAKGLPGTLTLDGYVSTYYAYYTDSIPIGSFEKFPTAAPYSDAISLNMALLGISFVSEKSRAKLNLHYGDIPQSAWSGTYNVIQEANAGLRLFPRLWLDAGFFRTHLGIESIQPRENMTSSISLVTYFEPYFLSGAKLTYTVSPKLHIQLNGFNNFNTFTENNRKKLVGLSAIYEPGEKFSLTFNTLYSDHAPADTNVSFRRVYNNLYCTYRLPRVTIGFEANFGVQEHAELASQGELSVMHDALLAVKYKIAEKLYVYGRADYVYDPDELLTGPVYNENHRLVGLEIMGFTGGFEIKPVENSYLRFESRYMQSTSGENLFYYHNHPSTIRLEYITSLGVWF